MKAGRIAEATASLRKAIRYSDGEDGIDNLARGQLRLLDDIIRDSSPFLTVDEFIENQKLFDQAFECLRRKEYEKSAGLFRRVLENHPGHVQSHGNLGLAEAALGHKATEPPLWHISIKLLRSTLRTDLLFTIEEALKQ